MINYSFPLTIEDYVHRIGRTGRAGKDGVAHSFFHRGDYKLAGCLVKVLKDAEQVIVTAQLNQSLFGSWVIMVRTTDLSNPRHYCVVILLGLVDKPTSRTENPKYLFIFFVTKQL